MSFPRNPDLRVVPTSSDAEHRVTLRIDAERPVPAPPANADEARLQQQAAAERELDRLNQAAAVEQLALGQHMNWLVASQAVVIHAFLMVFLVGSLGVAGASHALLGGLALLGIFCALALHSSIQKASHTLALLIVQRRAAEAELVGLSGRTPNLPKEPPRVSTWAGPLFVVVWLLLLAGAAAIRF